MKLKRVIITLFVIFWAVPSWAGTLIYESEWLKPVNGLSAQMVFIYEDYSNRGAMVKIIHPILMLRNDSTHPIKFFKCVYHAGDFHVKTSDGQDVQDGGFDRGGAQGADIIVIKPSEVITFDAYDYGYGIDMNSDYVFNTSSFQAVLKPGKYIIDYLLGFDKEQIEKFLVQYDWIKDNPDSIWTGKIEMNDIEINLR